MALVADVGSGTTMTAYRSRHGMGDSKNDMQTVAMFRIGDMLFEQFTLPDDDGQLVDQIMGERTMLAR